MTDRVDLSPKTREFLHASIRRDRSRRRRTTTTTTVLSVLLILALAAAGIAVIQRRDAQEQQRIATARQLVAQAEAARRGEFCGYGARTSATWVMLTTEGIWAGWTGTSNSMSAVGPATATAPTPRPARMDCWPSTPDTIVRLRRERRKPSSASVFTPSTARKPARRSGSCDHRILPRSNCPT